MTSPGYHALAAFAILAPTSVDCWHHQENVSTRTQDPGSFLSPYGIFEESQLLTIRRKPDAHDRVTIRSLPVATSGE
jgi:hypothetical protein